MMRYCVCVRIQYKNLDTFQHLFMRRLCVCNPVLFSASKITAAARADRGPYGSTVLLDGVLLVSFCLNYKLSDP